VARRPDLSGQTALVTGATGGLGKAIARALHGAGAHVKLSGRRAEVLESLVAELGDRAESLPADLSKADEVAGLAQRAGAVDVVVANAGLGGTGELTGYTLEEADRVLDVNLRSAVHLTHALLPGMLERKRGHLIYISSIAGKTPSVGASLYGATKFGLRGFALALHEDLRGAGVGVTAVFPGFISDEGLWGDTDLKLPPGSGRLRTPDEVGAAVLKGIATGKPEIDVAPVVQRSGGWLTGFAPRLVAATMRRAGAAHLSADLAKAQREKR
jgi:short-subunit dehydrogenase